MRKLKTMKRRVNTTGVISAIYSKKNKFWIGDPGYVVSDADWDHWGNTTDWSSNGLAMSATHKPLMILDNTALGDGTYDGFAVDSGNLGVVPVENIRKDVACDYLGEYVTVKPGTPLKMQSFGDFDEFPGRFEFTWVDPQDKPQKLVIDTVCW